MKLLDASIIIYAIGKAHLYKKSCYVILERAARSRGEYTIDVEVLQEILHLYHARHQRKKGFSAVEDMIILFPSPIPIAKAEILKAKELMKSYSFLTARDALHAAVVITQDLEAIVSTDKSFDKVKEIKRIDPEQ